MLTNDMSKKKKCLLHDGKVIIDGESYEIKNIKQIPRPRVWPVFILFACATIGTLLYFFTYPGYLLLQDAIDNPNLLDRVSKTIIIMLLVIGFPALWVVFINLVIFRRKTRNSWWKVNDYHYLWVEKDDPPETESILRQISRTVPEGQQKITPNKRILRLALLCPILIAIGLCLKKNPLIEIIMLLSGFSLLIVIIIFRYFELRKQTTWKK